MPFQQEVLSLLQEIHKEVSSRDSGTLMTLIGVGGTLLGTTITGLIGWWSRRDALASQRLTFEQQLAAEQSRITLEIKSEIVTKQRQQWMDRIRECSSTVIAQYDMACNYLADQRERVDQQTMDALLQNAQEKTNFIVLMLNPDKPEQKEVRDSIEALQLHLQRRSRGGKADDSEYARLRTAVFDSLTSLFRLTWEKIKNLEP